MNNRDVADGRNRQYRIIQLLMAISGLAFVAVGVVLLVSGGGGADIQMTVLAIALIIIGFGDLVLAFFVFRGADKRVATGKDSENGAGGPQGC